VSARSYSAFLKTTCLTHEQSVKHFAKTTILSEIAPGKPVRNTSVEDALAPRSGLLCVLERCADNDIPRWMSAAGHCSFSCPIRLRGHSRVVLPGWVRDEETGLT